jgi:hypothetical protein
MTQNLYYSVNNWLIFSVFLIKSSMLSEKIGVDMT